MAPSGGRMGGSNFASSRSSAPKQSSQAPPPRPSPPCTPSPRCASPPPTYYRSFDYNYDYYRPPSYSKPSAPPAPEVFQETGYSRLEEQEELDPPAPAKSVQDPPAPAKSVEDPPGPVKSGQEEPESLLKDCFAVLCILAVIGLIFFAISCWGSGDEGRQIKVHKIQVCMSGITSALQKDLDWVAETADTSSPNGLQYVLTETARALLRYPDFWFSAYSSVDVKESELDAEKQFKHFSFQERAKFDEVTLVNFNNFKLTTITQGPKGVNNEYIVVTILLAVEKTDKLPVISKSTDLKAVLEKLSSMRSDQIMALEVLWTPQKENDTLTARVLHEEYPLLKSI